MSNSDIVIPRSELPHVENLGTGKIMGPTLSVYAGSVHADALRKDAYERLAIAERIDHDLAEAKFIAEGTALDTAACLYRKSGDNQWTALARAAREVYGIK